MNKRPQGNNVAKRRLELGLSQQSLAVKAGLSMRAVQRIESGASPRLDTAQQLARALDSTVAELFDQERVAS